MSEILSGEPDKKKDWVEAAISWLWINVAWGLIAILIGVFAPLVGGAKIRFTDDQVLALIVLSLTLFGTQLEFPPELSAKQAIARKWLNRIAYIALIFGAIMAFVITKDNPIINSEKIDRYLVNSLSIGMLVVAIGLAFFAFVLRTRAEDAYVLRIAREARGGGDYSMVVEQNQKAMIDESNEEAKSFGSLKL